MVIRRRRGATPCPEGAPLFLFARDDSGGGVLRPVHPPDRIDSIHPFPAPFATRPERMNPSHAAC
jgi:hypothetical protein